MDKKDREFFETLAREYSSFTGDKITAEEVRDHFESQVREMDGSLVDLLSEVETARSQVATAPESRGRSVAEKRADWASKMSLFTYGQDLVDWGVSRGKFRDATQPVIDATKKSIQQSLDSIGAMSALPAGFEEATSTSNTSLGRVPVPQTSPRGRGGAIGNLPTGNWGNSPNLGYQKIDPSVSRMFVGDIATKGTTPNEGIDKMTQRAQQGLLDFARASGRYQPTFTATVGSHPAGNKTHSVGRAAYDVRTRDLSPAAVRAQLEAAMYTRPDRIAFNDSAFKPHLHVDYNGAYGRGVASRSRTGGLPADLQMQLQAFDAYHKGTNPGWVPAVPTAIAPTPERAPRGPLGPSLAAITGTGRGRVSDEMARPSMPSSATRMATGPTNSADVSRWRDTTNLLSKAEQRIAELNRNAIANMDPARFANFTDIPSRASPNAYGAPTAIGQGAMTNAGTDNRGSIGPGNQGMVNLERSLMRPGPVDRFREAARPMAPAGTPANMGAAGYGLSRPASTGQNASRSMTANQQALDYANRVSPAELANQYSQYQRGTVPAASAVPPQAPAPMSTASPQGSRLAAGYAGYAAARGYPMGATLQPAPQPAAPLQQRAAPAPVVTQPQRQITNEPQFSGRTPGDRARSSAFQLGGIFGYTSQQARGGGGYNPTPV